MQPIHVDQIRDLHQPNDSKIVLLVLDGLGGLPRESDGLTELETADTPEMDALAAEGITGLHLPVGPGITPGSGPGHLGVFGYDPLTFKIGRGALAAAGIDFDLQPDDVVARGNFCTVDDGGTVTDRRAGRIETAENERLCKMLQDIRIDGVEVFVRTIKEHRFLLVLRGENLSDAISDTDPKTPGRKPLAAESQREEAKTTVGYVNQFLEQASQKLHKEEQANMVLLRGFARKPDWPAFKDVYGLKAAATANYPMYCGLARLLGMQVLPFSDTLEKRVNLLRDRYSEFDFFFIHHKPTDSRGEDGDFEAKVKAIEEADACARILKELDPAVLIVTGDHSTPASLQAHSWHPVPALLNAATCRPDEVTSFGERACARGGMGPRFPATALMPLALAHARRLKKYGA